MELTLLYILIAVFIISLISLVGVFALSLRKNLLDKIIRLLVAFAAGTILATVFFELIPESYEALGNFNFVIIGMVLFFIMEAIIHWHHHHVGECKECLQPIVYLNLIGDAFHNFLDGVIIAASFIINIPAGIAITIAIALHEIPQEIGDFAVLVHGGMKRRRAVLFNFISALFAVVGGVVSYFFLTRIDGLIPYVVALATGGLLYIAATDILPELHKERDYKKIAIQTIVFILGILLIWLVINFVPE